MENKISETIQGFTSSEPMNKLLLMRWIKSLCQFKLKRVLSIEGYLKLFILFLGVF